MQGAMSSAVRGDEAETGRTYASARMTARSARHSGQRLFARAWMSASHCRHTKCAKRGVRHAQRPRGLGEQRSGCGRSVSKSSRQTEHDVSVGGATWVTPTSSGARAASGRAT